MRAETSTPAETEAVAAELAARVEAGDVALIRGGLGTGKTTFVRGGARRRAGKAPLVAVPARGVGGRGSVTSPTFTIGQVYAADGLEIAHLDLYRLTSL